VFSFDKSLNVGKKKRKTEEKNNIIKEYYLQKNLSRFEI
jgi:hypothetical protein